jgi:hypothetical protein
MNAVACAGSFCTAIGGAYSEAANGGVAVADSWDAADQTWTADNPNLGAVCRPPGRSFCYWTEQIACGDSANCMTLDLTIVATPRLA